MLEHYAEVGQILMAQENGDPCGYLIHGNGDHWCKIYQACIQYDARRREHGFELVRRLARKATEEGFEAISLWCAEDLEANEFWRLAGFVWAGQREGGKRRGRKHNRWILWLQPILGAAE
jgi:ribosomal protein S18 acetylase RimI-like enzyme